MNPVRPFRPLLNRISHELTDANLRSLKHICGPYVSGNRQDKIYCGLDLFDSLIHRNIIGDDLEQMHNLLYFMREMRPLRKDIIKMVKVSNTEIVLLVSYHIFRRQTPMHVVKRSHGCVFILCQLAMLNKTENEFVS